MTRGITSPTVDNTTTSAQFSIGGSHPYTDGYWWRSNATHPTEPVKKLVYDFYMYVPAGIAPQAIEFECQQAANGYIYNFAWQANYGAKIWRTFDYTAKKWVPTTMPFPGFTPGWHHIIAEYHAEGSNTVHDALTIDGVRTAVNVTRPATYTGHSSEYLTNAFQLDLNSAPSPFSVYVDKMKITFE
jgi:hypothetical protein